MLHDKMADDDQDGVVVVRERETFNEVHGNRIPRPGSDWEELVGAEQFVVDRFVAATS